LIDWAQHVTVGMSTEQRNHKKHTFSWLSKGDPVQVRNEQAAGMSSNELASSGVGMSFRRLHRYSGAGDSAFPADCARLPHAWRSVLSHYP